MTTIELSEDVIRVLANGMVGDSVLRCLAMSWVDAKEYRSVKQNSAQRMALIETAMKDYLAKLPITYVADLSNRLGDSLSAC